MMEVSYSTDVNVSGMQDLTDRITVGNGNVCRDETTVCTVLYPQVGNILTVFESFNTARHKLEGKSEKGAERSVCEKPMIEPTISAHG